MLAILPIHCMVIIKCKETRGSLRGSLLCLWVDEAQPVPSIVAKLILALQCG